MKRLLTLKREPKKLPDTITCDRDGWEMRFVSIDLGYSCMNPTCPCHVNKAVTC